YDDFTRSFYQSDMLVILPIYPAGEKRIEGIDSDRLSKGIRAHGHKEVIYMEDFNSTSLYLKKTLKAGDILLTLGAGDVWKIGEEIISELESESPAD
ncbi:UDP-N-acetylmuramate--L-alanine ligase, partial [Desulfobacteraceae bacterium SEEP-SAG9]